MKHEQWQTPLCAAALAFLISFGGLSCLSTAFALEGVNYAALALCCAVSAGLFALCVRLRLGLVPLCVSVALVAYLWIWGGLQHSLEAMLFRISDMYDRGYGWGVLVFDEDALTNSALAVCMLGFVSAAICASVLAAGKGSWVAVALGILPLGFCLVLTDTVPQVWCLGVVFAGCILVLLTQAVRKRSLHQGNALTLMLCVPVALSLVLLFTLSPRETYRGQEWAQKLEDWIQSWFEEPEEETPAPDPLLYPDAGGESEGATQVHLTAVGPRKEDWSMVMKVEADQPGCYYLRGCVYNYYTGTTWMYNGAGIQWPGEKFVQTGALNELKITTQKPHGVLYSTYNPVLDPPPANGRISNPKRMNSYKVQYLTPTKYDESWAQLIDYSSAAYAGQTMIYLKLPAETASWAGNILHDFDGYVGSGVYNAQEAWYLAQNIVSFVMQAANYDLNTRYMPVEATDFAKWFIESSATGYCVHYATAAAVLLRQAGIPSRYVTGYFVEVQPGRVGIVRAKDAHAWVECYIPGVGWIPLETTPGYYERVNREEYENPDAEQTRPTAPSSTEATEPTAEPTQPETTAPTEPPETTQPPTTQPPTQTPSEPENSAGPWWIALSVLLAVAAVLTQWRLRVWLRRRRRRRGDANTRALCMWKEARQVSALLGAQPIELHMLAQKARFSAHTLTDEELRQFTAYLHKAVKQLRSRSLLHRLYYMLILAIY